MNAATAFPKEKAKERTRASQRMGGSLQTGEGETSLYVLCVWVLCSLCLWVLAWWQQLRAGPKPPLNAAAVVAPVAAAPHTHATRSRNDGQTTKTDCFVFQKDVAVCMCTFEDLQEPQNGPRPINLGIAYRAGIEFQEVVWSPLLSVLVTSIASWLASRASWAAVTSA